MKKTIDNLSNWVIESKQFFWIAFLSIAFSSIIQTVLFFSNLTLINGHYFNEIKGLEIMESVTIFIRLIFTSIGSILATLGLLIINRNNKNFFYFSLTACFLLTVNGLFSSLFFESIKWLFVGIILLIQAIVWNNKNNVVEIKKVRISYILMSILLILVVSFTVGFFGVSSISKESVFYNKKPILDPIQFSFTIIGNIMMIFFIVESRIIYLIGNIITMMMFSMIIAEGDLLSITQLLQSILYTVITISGYININNKYKEVNKDA